MKKPLPIFEVFRSGIHKDKTGKEIEISDDALKQMVRQYHPKMSEAPIVIGHPHDNEPAFGWIKKIFIARQQIICSCGAI